MFLILFCFSCSSIGRTRDNDDAYDSLRESNINQDVKIGVDSIEITSYRIYELGQDPNSIIVELSNPYADTITLDNYYNIHDMNSDSIVLRGSNCNAVMDPKSSMKLKLSLGLDSIWYDKDKMYMLTLSGVRNDQEIIFYSSKIRLGLINKINGTEVIVPDTIILCSLHSRSNCKYVFNKI